MPRKKSRSALPDVRSLVDEFGVAGALRVMAQGHPQFGKIKATVLATLDRFMADAALQAESHLRIQLTLAMTGKDHSSAMLQELAPVLRLKTGSLWAVTADDAGNAVNIPLTYFDLRKQVGFEAVLKAAKDLQNSRARILLKHEGGYIDLNDNVALMNVQTVTKARLVVVVDSRYPFDGDTHYQPQTSAPPAAAPVLVVS